MPYQIISPFVMPLDGDSFTNALKNYAKLNYMSNINQLIVTDQAQNMVANMKYYDDERGGRRVKIGVEPTRHRRLASLSPRRDYAPAYGMGGPMMGGPLMAPGGVMMGAPGGVMMAPGGVMRGAPGIVLGAPSLDYAKLIKSKEYAITLKNADIEKETESVKKAKLEKELKDLTEQKKKLEEARILVETIKTTTEDLKEKREELAKFQREVASSQPRPSIFGLPIPFGLPLFGR